MAQYRIKEGAQRRDGYDGVARHAGFVFEWDGTTVDGDGDIAAYGAERNFKTFVLPEWVEPVGPKAEVIEETRTVVEKVYVLRLTETEAEHVRRILGQQIRGGATSDVYHALNDALNA